MRRNRLYDARGLPRRLRSGKTDALSRHKNIEIQTDEKIS
ncbi:hypothetical protein HMPREF9555_02019 [Selenomonas artemidis F0399]|uniref:Uncharacterized protein n=1 Tax=Selenomonas artemidis F0399 TaxID=749551 RepID=E7N4S4_9FIRM|nr:hypothetical protein HMPREF9162_0621 [Selenomonas sp. oral taxon 137 str. F0430]EFW28805.1 hypothetical protein HMPREF9555_02019 [Selenomonas artemidis F0399]